MHARRLLLVSPTFWPEPVGTPKYALDTARWFRDRGWQVAVVTAQPFYPDFVLYGGWGPSRRRDSVDGIPILRMPTIVPSGGASVRRMASDVNFAVQTAVRAMQRTVPAPDAVLSFSPGVPLAVASASLFASGTPHTCIVHDIQSGLARSTGMAPGRVADVMEVVEAQALSTADQLLALSEPMAEELRTIGVRRPVGVVPIWTDITVAASVPSGGGAPFTVSYSGNFGRKQGIPLLLDVATELKVRGAPVRIVLRGRGALREQAETTVRVGGLDNVELEDFVPADQVGVALQAADLHVVPQLSGSGAFAMPSKVINILASGRPMMAICDEGDPLHAVSQQGLSLWSPVDPEAVADRIVELAADPGPGEEIARRGLDYVAEHHDRDVLLRRVEDTLLR